LTPEAQEIALIARKYIDQEEGAPGMNSRS